MASSDVEHLDELLEYCPEIEEGARYWFFRTEGGMLFEPFVTTHSIALGYPTIDLQTLLDLNENPRSRERLEKQVKIDYPDEKRPGLAVSQMMVFTHTMKKGDYVIIPSANSRDLAIGQISGRPPFEEDLIYNRGLIEGFSKRRAVKWLKRVRRSSVNPNLYPAFAAHQTISDISEYAQWIDPLLFDFFRKGDSYHFVLEVTQERGINARDLFYACVELFKLSDDASDTLGIDEDSGNIQTRINLNSPGDLELITSAAKFIFTAALIVVFLNGGGLKIDLSKGFNFKLNLSTDGLIKKISEFLTDRKNRAIADSLKGKLESLKVKTPEDIVKILEEVNKNK